MQWTVLICIFQVAESPDVSYLYFMPVFMLCSLEEGTLWTESCPRLRATIATALNLLRVPVLGLLAFCRFSRSSVLRLTPPRWSVHTSDTCILTWSLNRGWNSEQTCGDGETTALLRCVTQFGPSEATPLRHARLPPLKSLLSGWTAWAAFSKCSVKTGAASGSECAQTPAEHSSGKNKILSNKVQVQHHSSCAPEGLRNNEKQSQNRIIK